MKREVLAAMSFALTASVASADVTINFPAGTQGTYEVETQLISEYVKPKKERKAPEVEEVTIKDGNVVIKENQAGAADVALYTSEREAIMLYTVPGDNLIVDVTSVEPLEYSVKGSKLMEDISSLDNKGNEIKKEYFAEARSENPDQEKLNRIRTSYDILYSDFMKQNPESVSAVYALLQLDGEDFLNMYSTLSAKAKESPLYPLAENKKLRVESNIAAERKLQELQSGNVDAPDFTLKNLEGKEVSLSDFRGKWVILDFWGSWCPWCIKGFPSLKDAYNKYAGKLEIIGVDCRDSEEAWRNAVAKYELPWVQLYTNEEQAAVICDMYAVQGFPTKVVVSPEGKIANITVGEDPAFFSVLGELIK